MKQPIGILGGTFDPVHNGHLQIARIILDKLHLKEVRFIPCFEPVHRTKPEAAPLDRLNMLKLALKDEPNFVLDDREFNRKGPSFMIDTLISLRSDFQDTPLCLIMGTDAFENIDSWHKSTELLKYAHFIVIHRKTEKQAQQNSQPLWSLHETHAIQALHETLHGSIYHLSIDPINLCATGVRAQIKKHKFPIQGLPQTVLNYIQSHKLYLNNKEPCS